MLDVIVDVNRIFGRAYYGPRTDVFVSVFEPSDGFGYLVQFDPEAGTVITTAFFD